MRVGRWGVGVLAAFVVAAPAGAQFSQYTAPGSLAVREAPTKERLEKAIEAARWHFGGLRLSPWFGIRNATYYDDVLPDVPGKQSDLRITAGAGLTGILPVGSKIVIAGHALPEYDWWRNLSNRRTWNGRYGIGAAAYFNRLTIEGFGARDEEAQYASSEVELPVNVRSDRGHANVKLRVLKSVFLYGSATKSQWRYDARDLGVTGDRLRWLDRDETAVEGGLQWEPTNALRIRAGAKRVEVDFLHQEFDRSSEGTAPVVAVLVGTDRTGLDASLARFDIKPVGESSFTPYRGTTGKARVWRDLAGGATWTVYGGRDLGFTAYTGSSGYYIQQRVGTSLAFPMGWRGSATVYAETGSLDYVSVPMGGQNRNDDLRAFGIQLRFLLARSASLVIGVSKTRYDSSVPGADRTYTRVQTGLVFGTSDPTVW